MMNFNDFYYFDLELLEIYDISNDLLIEGEIPANILLHNIDKGRGYRGIYDVKVLDTKQGSPEPNVKWMSYKFRSNPSTQLKNHFGYVTWDESKKAIREVYCSCSDFNFRMYYPLVQRGLAKWNIDRRFLERTTTTKFQNGVVTQTPFRHNHTNGKGIANVSPARLIVCKHLYNAIRSYVMGAMKSSRLPDESIPIENKPLGDAIKKAQEKAAKLEQPTI